MSYNRTLLVAYRSKHSEVTNAVWEGKPIWVEIDTGARNGTIGLLSPVGCKPMDINSYPALSRAAAMYGVDKFDLHVPGKKPITIRIKNNRHYLLEGYQGPAVFQYKSTPREKKEKFQPKDITGYPIAVNNMVVFTTPQLGTLQYGTVERISDSGLTVYIKRIDIVNVKYIEGTRWDKDVIPVASSTNIGDNRSDRITVIRSDLLTDLMRVKLSL